MKPLISWKLLFFGLFLSTVFIANVVMTYTLFTSQFAGQNDFLSRWEGARIFWQEGESPYSNQATRSIQQKIYGREALPTEDAGLFVYPFYTALLIAPLTMLSYAWASAVIIVLLEFSVIVALFLLLDLYGWRVKPILLAVLLLWTLFLYYSARGVILGQLGLWVYLCQIGAVWAIWRNYDFSAGVLLALSTIKPQMGFLIVPFLLLWAIRDSRWRVLWGFLGVFGVLMSLSFLLQPNWFGAWIEQVRLYPTYTRDGSPVWVIVQHWLHLGDGVEGVVNALFAGGLAWAWWGILVKRQSERFLWTIALTLVMTHTIGLKTATPHFVVFTLPFLFWLKRLPLGQQLLLLALTLIVPWVHFIATIDGNLEHLSLFLPAPLLTLVGLWITRHTWWQFSPRQKGQLR